MNATQKPQPRNPTSSYMPRATSLSAITAYVWDGKPWYSYHHAPRMRRDPFVNWLLDLWQYPFQQVKFQISSNSVSAQAFVQKSLQRFWSRYLPVILKNYCCYGFAPAGFEYQVKGGLWRLNTVTPVQPLDARPHHFSKSTKFAGFAINDKGLVASPYAFYFAGYEEMGLFYDRPPLAGVYDPWLEANGRGGAKDLRQLLMRKYAIPLRTLYHPSGTVNMVDKDGNETEMQWADIAMLALEYMESGSNVAIVGDRDDKGNRKLEIEPMQSAQDSPSVREYPSDLKKEMAAGMGIPMEVLEAAESGSGYSGRKIPYLAWLGKADQMSGLVIESFDAAIRPVVQLNFGPKVDYEITPMSLVESAKKEDQPDDGPQGGQAIGGPQGGGGSPRPGLVPYSGPHGGRGWKNPQTGKVSYGMSATEGGHPAAGVSARVRGLVGAKKVKWDEALHPRDDAGQWVEKDLIKAGRKSRFVAEGIRRQVTRPEERAKLDKLLAGKSGKTDKGQDGPAEVIDTRTMKVDAERQLTEREAGKLDKEAERLKKAEGRAKHAAGIIREVASRGGLDPDSQAFKARYGTRKEAVESGVPSHILKKGGQPLDTFADELASSGAIYVPDDRHAEDVLLEMIQNREAHGHAGFEAQEIAGQRETVEQQAEAKRADAEKWAKRAEVEKEKPAPVEDDSFDVGSFEDKKPHKLREPWEITRAELRTMVQPANTDPRGGVHIHYSDGPEWHKSVDKARAIVDKQHKQEVTEAILQGRAVPEEVLNDYPDLRTLKPIHQMTIDEYRKHMKGKPVEKSSYYNREGSIQNAHRNAVIKAIQSGQTVPEENINQHRTSIESALPGAIKSYAGLPPYYKQ